MKLYHGSLNDNVKITADGENFGYNFGAVFFTYSYYEAKGYGRYVYTLDFNDDYFDGEESDDTDKALLEVMAERGIGAEHFDFCYDAVIKENLNYDEGNEWAELLGMDWEYANWEAQAMRIEVARKLGYKACGMNDECGSIAILPEYCDGLVPAVDPDEEEDE